MDMKQLQASINGFNGVQASRRDLAIRESPQAYYEAYLSFKTRKSHYEAVYFAEQHKPKVLAYIKKLLGNKSHYWDNESMSIKAAKGAKAKADKYFSLLIRSVGRCLRCGSTDNLQTSHIIGRTYSATRTLEDNAQCLCAKCHWYFTNNPVEFGHWVDDTIGREAYDRLWDKARTVTKIDWEQEAARLKQALADL